jgi:hypothetical protein
MEYKKKELYVSPQMEILEVTPRSIIAISGGDLDSAKIFSNDNGEELIIW